MRQRQIALASRSSRRQPRRPEPCDRCDFRHPALPPRAAACSRSPASSIVGRADRRAADARPGRRVRHCSASILLRIQGFGVMTRIRKRDRRRPRSRPRARPRRDDPVRRHAAAHPRLCHRHHRHSAVPAAGARSRLALPARAASSVRPAGFGGFRAPGARSRWPTWRQDDRPRRTTNTVPAPTPARVRIRPGAGSTATDAGACAGAFAARERRLRQTLSCHACHASQRRDFEPGRACGRTIKTRNRLMANEEEKPAGAATNGNAAQSRAQRARAICEGPLLREPRRAELAARPRQGARHRHQRQRQRQSAVGQGIRRQR